MLTSHGPNGETWTKSSYSSTTGGDCVEVAAGVPGLVPVRDSKYADSPALAVPAAAWSAFVDALKDAERS